MKKKLPWYRLCAINSYWLGINSANGTLTPLLLPYLVLLLVPPQVKNSSLASLRVLGLTVAMLVQPLAGMLSDRSTSRFGKRRPYIFVSAFLSVLFLLVIGSVPQFIDSHLDRWVKPLFGVPFSFIILLFGVVLLQASSNLGHGALQALIPDVVPVHQRGRASGIKAVFELLPVLLIMLMGPLVDHGKIWWVTAIIASGYLSTMTVTCLFVEETPQVEKKTDSIREPLFRIVGLAMIFVTVTQAVVLLVRFIGAWLAGQGIPPTLQLIIVGGVGLFGMASAIYFGVYFSARIGIGKQANTYSGFIWWVINRLLFLAAITSIQGFALYFLKDSLHIKNAASMTTTLLAVVALFLVPSALLGGVLADRFGKKRWVALSGVIASVGTVCLLFSSNIPLVIISGSIIGLASGLFMATSWALGTALVPTQDAGRFLGISNLAGAGAGIVGSGIGGPIADFFNQFSPGSGYLMIFAIYAVLFLLSALALLKVE